MESELLELVERLIILLVIIVSGIMPVIFIMLRGMSIIRGIEQENKIIKILESLRADGCPFADRDDIMCYPVFNPLGHIDKEATCGLCISMNEYFLLLKGEKSENEEFLLHQGKHSQLHKTLR